MDPQLGRFPAYDLPDRRRSERFKLGLVVNLSISCNGKSTIVAVRGTDVSEGGLGMYARTKLSPGDEISIQLTAMHMDRLAIRGIVRYRSGCNYGVQFKAETSEEQEQVGRFCALLWSGSQGDPQ